ncbi:MAG: VIT domain-containing protein [Chthoniobacteraceae bacterium]
MKRSPSIIAFCLAWAALLSFPSLGHGQKVQNWPRLIVSQGASEPMQIKEMSVQSRIAGLQAEVATTLTFYNPNPRQLEGELSFPLPDGALVTGYALDINGKMIDGVVVKKEKARVAFETEARRRVDPGLVEHVAGNVYRTRIYPLPPQGTRRIQLPYVTPLAVDANAATFQRRPLPQKPRCDS